MTAYTFAFPLRSQVIFKSVSQKKQDIDKDGDNAQKAGNVRRSQILYKAEDPYERCGFDQGFGSGPCDHPRANHRVSSAGRGFCLECQQKRPGAISSDIVHEFLPKKGITGSVPRPHLNTVPLSRVNRVAHPDPAEVRQHHEQMLTGLETLRERFHGRPFRRTDTTVAAAQASTNLDDMRARYHGTARDKTEKSRRSQRAWRR